MTPNKSPSRRRVLALELSHCLDVCRASELYCALVMDVAGLRDDPAARRAHDVLRTCIVLCAATASAIEQLREPDLDRVAEVLLACRVACSAARTECERHPLVACWMECAASCGECADVCASLLAHAGNVPRARATRRVERASATIR